jgi:hypothetical protein
MSGLDAPQPVPKRMALATSPPWGPYGPLGLLRGQGCPMDPKGLRGVKFRLVNLATMSTMGCGGLYWHLRNRSPEIFWKFHRR